MGDFIEKIEQNSNKNVSSAAVDILRRSRSLFEKVTKCDRSAILITLQEFFCNHICILSDPPIHVADGVITTVMALPA